MICQSTLRDSRLFLFVTRFVKIATPWPQWILVSYNRATKHMLHKLVLLKPLVVFQYVNECIKL